MSSLDRLTAERLEQVVKQPGCPACGEMERSTSRYLRALLREPKSADGVLKRLQRTWGLCRQHTRGMIAEESSGAVPSVYTAALYRRLAETMLDRAGWGKPRAERFTAAELRALLRPEGMCLACEELGEYQRAVVQGLVRTLASHESVRDAYFSGEGLCLPHLRLALGVVEDRVIATSLARHFLSGIHAVAVDLEAFLASAPAQTASSTSVSSGAWRRAVERFTGRLGS